MNIEKYSSKMFEDIKHIDESGNEYWYARELQKVLEYTEYRKFIPVINKAKNSCFISGYMVGDHFARVSGMISLAKGAQRRVDDYKLSRYACYLIAMNGDSRKRVIALAQTYFAIQTRKQELLESEYKFLSEDEKRLMLRDRTKKGNYSLNRTAINSGVKNLDKFHNAGYKGLYNGETADDIAKRKGLRYREDILDNMGSTELAANLFRITQTDDKLKNDKIETEQGACDTHYKMGRDIRNFIKKQGGTMPEDLPKPKKSLKQIKKDSINYL